MSREISFLYSLSVSKSGVAFSLPQATLRVDQSGNRFVSNVQQIGTSVTGLNVNGQTFVPGYAQFTNTTRTSGQEMYIGVGTGNWVPMLRLGSGQVGIMPLNTLSISAQCNSGTGNLYYTIIER